MRTASGSSGLNQWGGRCATATLGAIVIALFLLALASGRAAQPVVMPHLDEVVSTNSVFTDDPNFGKDPFFPLSKRHLPVVVAPPVKTVPVEEIFGQVLGSVVLNGISGVPSKRLALLGYRTVGVGEDVNIKFNGKSYRVRCLEIHDNSVLLGIDGSKETKEIHLRAGR